MEGKKYAIASQVVHGSKGIDPKTGAISTPIYQSATFKHTGLYETTGYDYSRLKNPTRDDLEMTIADLEEGLAGFAFSSGMAAITTILKLFSQGDHLVVSDDLYGGTYRLLTAIYNRFGMEVTFVDTCDVDQTKEAIRANTKAVFIETPSNPMMKVTDIEATARLCQDHNLLLIVDNTFLSPFYQKPLLLGADIVVHSGTKYLGGHNDTLAGLLVVKSQALAEEIGLLQKSEGAVLSPFDSFLILRGLKTLALRMTKQSENALHIARWLQKHPQVKAVHFVGLEEHPGYALNCKQACGSGGMISFEVVSADLVPSILKKVRLITFAESLGGVETLITYPMVQTHAAIPEDIRNRLGVTDRLLRLSVGIEDVKDIIEDLEEALKS